jgi:nucleoside-diphosphate-sugar epimerase
MVSGIMLFIAKVSGRPPMLVPGVVRKLKLSTQVSSAKAVRELGYNPVDFRTGAQVTLNWLKNM